jgi:HEAT repeat protein
MMGYFREPRYIDALKSTLYFDANLRVALYTSSALGRIGIPALDALLDAARDLPSEKRTSVMMAIHNIGKDAIPALLQALKRPSPHFRWSIIRLLSDFGDEQCLPELQRIVAEDTGKTELDTVANMAQRAIDAINRRYSSNFQLIITPPTSNL